MCLLHNSRIPTPIELDGYVRLVCCVLTLHAREQVYVVTDEGAIPTVAIDGEEVCKTCHITIPSPPPLSVWRVLWLLTSCSRPQWRWVSE